MQCSDRLKFKTSNPNDDFPALGQAPTLTPLNRQFIRQALSMMNPDSIPEREIAARYLIGRIKDYYAVIGYVGPLHASGGSEIGQALAGWCTDPHFKPWRQVFVTGNKQSWANPERIFNSVRFIDFESALLLAAWEASVEVPESAEGLKRAAWLALRTIKGHTSRPWNDIRNKMGTTSMRKELSHVLQQMESLQLQENGRWLGSFLPKAA